MRSKKRMLAIGAAAIVVPSLLVAIFACALGVRPDVEAPVRRFPKWEGFTEAEIADLLGEPSRRAVTGNGRLHVWHHSDLLIYARFSEGGTVDSAWSEPRSPSRLEAIKDWLRSWFADDAVPLPPPVPEPHPAPGPPPLPPPS